MHTKIYIGSIRMHMTEDSFPRLGKSPTLKSTSSLNQQRPLATAKAVPGRVESLISLVSCMAVEVRPSCRRGAYPVPVKFLGIAAVMFSDLSYGYLQLVTPSIARPPCTFELRLSSYKPSILSKVAPVHFENSTVLFLESLSTFSPIDSG